MGGMFTFTSPVLRVVVTDVHLPPRWPSGSEGSTCNKGERIQWDETTIPTAVAVTKARP